MPRQSKRIFKNRIKHPDAVAQPTVLDSRHFSRLGVIAARNGTSKLAVASLLLSFAVMNLRPEIQDRIIMLEVLRRPKNQ